MTQKRILILSLSLVLGLAACLSCSDFLEKDNAKNRIDAVFSGLKETGLTQKYQTAICMWAKGVVVITDRAELERAMTDFELWFRQKQIKPPIGAYEIKSIEMLPGEANPTAIAVVTVDGVAYKVKVPKKENMTWAH
jgi:hypothetical protein